MNNIIFTRGVPGSGKTTYLENHKLTSYVLSPDNLRLIYSSPVLNLDGNLEINQLNDRKIWTQLLEVLEFRMQKGDFIIIDATHTNSDDFKKYKDLVEKYRYRAWCLDFSDISLETAIEQNKKRLNYKIVNDEVIKKMYTRLKDNKVPSWITILDKTNFSNWLNLIPVNIDHYKKIYHIGDIHGCFTTLKQFFELNPISEDEFFIFTGDYVDRGIENAKTINFLIELFETKHNFIFLEGNHDNYLWQWANNFDVKTQEFNANTKIELEENNVDKSKVRNFCRNMKKYFYYTYKGKTIVVTHGGISNIPANFRTISGNQFIHGVGTYGDYLKCDESFEKLTPENYFSIHGHRNVSQIQTKVNEKCFNLEGEIEFGGNLRIVALSELGFEIIELKNNVFRGQNKNFSRDLPINQNNLEQISKLRENKLISERKFANNISSFNFKREAFYKGIWNEQTMKARGLFVNNKNYEVIARSYEKFFNIGEMDFTEYEYLEKNLVFPIQVYKKENGYLGLIGYNAEFDEIVFTSKSSVENDFVNWFKEIFLEKFETKLDEIKTFLAEKNLTFVFEVIDPTNDPHIIEYFGRDIILLDAIKRNLDFEKLSYEELVQVSNNFGFSLKKLEKVITTQSEFKTFYEECIDISNQNQGVEGYVLEDNKSSMVKLKLPYYSYWKAIRNYLEMYKINKKVRISEKIAKDPTFIKFNSWIMSKDESYLEKPLIQLRKEFLSL